MTFMLAQAQRGSGDLQGAEATARALQAAHPEDVRATYLLAQMQEARGRYQEIVGLLKPEIARLKGGEGERRNHRDSHGTEGLALLQLKRDDEAVAALKDAMAARPTTRRCCTSSAPRSIAPAGRPTPRSVPRLIASDPLDASALNYWATCSPSTAIARRGRELIQRALKIEPDNRRTSTASAGPTSQQGKLDLADPPLTTPPAKMPKNSVIQEHLGDLRQKQNRRADAIAAWQRALAGDGDGIDRAKMQKKIDAARKVKCQKQKAEGAVRLPRGPSRFCRSPSTLPVRRVRSKPPSSRPAPAPLFPISRRRTSRRPRPAAA